MLELNIKCESIDEARIYLNAPQYLNLITDLQVAIRNAQKHGNDASVLQVVNAFYPDLCKAVDDNTGAY